MKRCSKCKQEKETSCFGKNKSTKDGYNGTCKACYCEYYWANKEAIAEYKREYYRYSREKIEDYRRVNKEVIAKHQREYFQANKRKIYEWTYKYNQINKEKIATYKREYREANAHKVAEYQREYRKANADKIEARRKAYCEANKEKINKRSRDKRRGNTNVQIANNLRKRVWKVLKGNPKASTTIKLLGCTVDKFKSYIEAQFQPGMTWDNYGCCGWHMDHRIPCASFDLTDPEQQRECFHYSNLQPLWAEDNIKKGARI